MLLTSKIIDYSSSKNKLNRSSTDSNTDHSNTSNSHTSHANANSTKSANKMNEPIVSSPSSYLISYKSLSKSIYNCNELYLGYKKIDILSNFNNYINLNILYLNNNKIVDIVGLSCCKRLKYLYIQYNRIITLLNSDIVYLKFLNTLNLSFNRIKDLDVTVNILMNLSFLSNLDLTGNPICDILNYRYYIIYNIKWLNILDCHEITDIERNKAKQLFDTNNAIITTTKKEIIKTRTLFDDITTESKLIMQRQKLKAEADKLAAYTNMNTSNKSNDLPLPNWIKEYENDLYNTKDYIEKTALLKSIFRKDKIIDVLIIEELLNDLSWRPNKYETTKLIDGWIESKNNKLSVNIVIKELANLNWNEEIKISNSKGMKKEELLDTLPYSLSLMKMNLKSESKDNDIDKTEKQPLAYDIYSTYRVKYNTDWENELKQLSSLKSELTIADPNKLKLSLLTSKHNSKVIDLISEGIFANAPHPLQSKNKRSLSLAKRVGSGKENKRIDPYELELVKELDKLEKDE